MNKAQTIKTTADFIKKTFLSDASGHDWWHIYRVWQTAKTLAWQEKTDGFVVQMAALLHDLGDYKLEPDRKDRQAEKVGAWLKKVGADELTASQILAIVTNISFSKNLLKKRQLSLEGQIVQDADRLDAIGAIGVMRNFVYAGAHKIPPYDPAVKPRKFTSATKYKQHEASSINHFYEKLLLLKNRMNTKTGKSLAAERHRFMQNYLREFFAEWKGSK